MNQTLNVTFHELPAVRVAMLAYHTESLGGVYSESIGTLFREVEGWLKHLGYDTHHLRRFGVPFNDGPILRRYWCCIEAPEGLAAAQGEVQLRDLAGGRYAILSLSKDAATIGPSIGRFYSEYVPTHGLTLDDTRPPIEVYHPETMDYCVPVI